MNDMDKTIIVNLVEQALQLILIISLPPIIITAVVGISVSLLLALTQLQEQTVTFVFKLVAIIIGLMITGLWIGEDLTEFTTYAFNLIGN